MLHVFTITIAHVKNTVCVLFSQSVCPSACLSTCFVVVCLTGFVGFCLRCLPASSFLCLSNVLHTKNTKNYYITVIMNYRNPL